MKPLIGILSSVDNEQSTSVMARYASVIERSGGLPILIPFTLNGEQHRAYTEVCDGFFFTGGADIDPLYYGEEASADCGEIQPYRDSLEFSMLDEVLRAKKPILAVCRGAQLVNVAFGGTLYQDIHNEYKTDISHRQAEPLLSHSHEVEISEGTPLKELFGENRVRVNSFHHQAVKTLGAGLCAMALADDGLIEAFYLIGKSYLRAYQWHPERLYDKDGYNKKIFDDFIAACRDGRNE